MFELNPLNLTDAWWQHLLMLLVAGILGYIIGYRTGNATIMDLHDRLALLNVDLQKCRKSLLVATPKVKEVIIPDDLKIIEGIGPKIESLLNQANILTFKGLSETSSDRIKQILEAAGPRFQMHNTETWPKQAALAAAGKWEELKKWQDELDGGRL